MGSENCGSHSAPLLISCVMLSVIILTSLPQSPHLQDEHVFYKIVRD